MSFENGSTTIMENGLSSKDDISLNLI